MHYLKRLSYLTTVIFLVHCGSDKAAAPGPSNNGEDTTTPVITSLSSESLSAGQELVISGANFAALVPDNTLTLTEAGPLSLEGPGPNVTTLQITSVSADRTEIHAIIPESLAASDLLYSMSLGCKQEDGTDLFAYPPNDIKINARPTVSSVSIANPHTIQIGVSKPLQAGADYASLISIQQWLDTDVNSATGPTVAVASVATPDDITLVVTTAGRLHTGTPYTVNISGALSSDDNATLGLTGYTVSPEGAIVPGANASNTHQLQKTDPLTNRAPNFSGLANVTKYGSDLWLQWTAAMDDTTTADNMIYVVYMSTGSSSIDYTSPLFSTPAGQTYATYPSAPSGTYHFAVRALDTDGAMDENTTTKDLTVP